MRTRERRQRITVTSVAPMMPQQIRDAIDLGRTHERSLIRLFLLGSMVAQVGFAAVFAWWGDLEYLPLIIVAVLTLPLYMIALMWLSGGNAVGAGVMAVAVPIGPLVAYTSAFSVDASVHIILFIFAVALFVLVPNDQPRARLYLGLGVFTAFILCESVFTEPNAWAPLDDDVTAVFAAVNRSFTAAGIILLAILLHRRLEYSRHILEGAARHGELLATTDELTGLPNRRPLIAQLEEFESRHITDYAIVLVDLDNFKSINDEYGHACGDGMLRHVAQHLRGHFRDSDMASRWGGDEFLILMPNVPRHSLLTVLERLRASIASMALPCGDHEHHVTVSVGAAHGITGESADECIAAADHALYRAKHEGRNRVVAVGTSDR